MSVISAGTTTTTAFKVTGDTTGTLQLQTGAVPTTAINISATQVVTFPATTTLDFTGTLLLGDGSAAAPTLAHSGDTNTGMFFPAADTIAFTEGGTEVLRLNSSAQVAVNTAGTAAAPVITKTDDLNTGIFFPAADTIAFSEGGVEALRIDSSANVGIGTSSPTYKLDVSSSGGSLFRLARGSVSFGTFLGTSDAFVGTFSNNNLVFITNDTTKAILDSSGNLGLGVTPSAWNSAYTAFQSRNASFFGTTNVTEAAIGANALIAAGGGRYISNGQASIYQQVNGTHIWYNAPSGTAGAVATFTQAMTLSAAGGLSVGTTDDAGAGNIRVPLTKSYTCYTADYGMGTPSSAGLQIYTASGDFISFSNKSGSTFTERARITSDGYWLVGTTLAGLSRVFHNNSGANTFQVANLSTNTSSSAMEVNVAYTGNTTGWFIRGGDLSIYRFYIYSNGNIVNSNGSYGTISDAKVKTDIVDAGSQWDDFKAVRFRKFKMKDDPTGLVQLGVVAQELEQTSPGLVDEHADRDAKGNDLGTTTKSVKTSVLLMKAAVALQEAMLRIENLEAEVNALKAN